MSASEIIEAAADDCIRASQFLKETESVAFMARVASRLIHCFENGGKVLIAGNGGSLCDAMHFAEELTGFFRHKRKPLPAIALADPGHMSCVSNDVDFSEVFSRSVEALGNPEDILIVLSTSGNSKNLIKAIDVANAKKMTTIGFLGKKGGKLRDTCNLCWIVPDFKYSDRIQEAHMAAIHIIIELTEKKLFQQPGLAGKKELSFS